MKRSNLFSDKDLPACFLVLKKDERVFFYFDDTHSEGEFFSIFGIGEYCFKKPEEMFELLDKETKKFVAFYLDYWEH